jgi:hypothetical protein
MIRSLNANNKATFALLVFNGFLKCWLKLLRVGPEECSSRQESFHQCVVVQLTQTVGNGNGLQTPAAPTALEMESFLKVRKSNQKSR